MIKLTSYLLLTLCSFSLAADSLYVSDTLRVGIRSEPNKGGPSIAVVTSGTKIDVLQKKGGYIKVRTKGGVEGWVKSAYFSRKAPVANRLKLAKSEIIALKEEIKALKLIPAKTESKIQEIQSKKLQQLNASNSGLIDIINQQRTQIKTNTNGSALISATDPNSINISEQLLYVTLGILIVILCIGFIVGVSWHKQQIAKRLGGMSI